jgi:lantibiotic modifying enzyme
VALALLELGATAEEEPFRVAAIRAFDYERRHFDPAAGNWRDFRQPGSDSWPVFANSWCNGAPGIGLSRLQAWRILQHEVFREEAATAFETTRAAVRRALDTPDPGFCLCHGLAGNADVLLEASGLLGEEWPGGLIEETAARAVAPPGTPGLMLGQAGLGYFYLRVADPRVVPTALLIAPGWLGG